MLRSLLYYLLVALLSIVVSVLFMITAPILSQRWRYKIVSNSNCMVINWMRLICGVRYEVYGKQHICRDQPMVLACNHQGEWETFFLLTLGIPASIVLKRELLMIPFFGWILAMTQPIAIDRSRKTNAFKQLIIQGLKRLHRGYSVIVFPQGTRLPPGQDGTYSKGAVSLACKAGVPILPIVQNSGELVPPRSWVKQSGTVTVIIGPPLEVAGRSNNDVHEELVSWMTDHLHSITSPQYLATSVQSTCRKG